MHEYETVVPMPQDGSKQSQTFASAREAEAARHRAPVADILSIEVLAISELVSRALTRTDLGEVVATHMEEQMKRELLGLRERVEDLGPETRSDEVTVRTRYARRPPRGGAAC